jgi:hypothetical protein
MSVQTGIQFLGRTYVGLQLLVPDNVPVRPSDLGPNLAVQVQLEEQGIVERSSQNSVITTLDHQ